MHSQIRNDYSTQGVLTERLGNGLQNRVERFDSARHLFKKKEIHSFEFPFFVYPPLTRQDNKDSPTHFLQNECWQIRKNMDVRKQIKHFPQNVSELTTFFSKND